MTRNSLSLIGSLGIAAFILFATARPAPAAESRPNVLFIAIDDLNTWTGFMGGHPNAKTPRMDELAARGTVFLNAHCQNPICGPSRASLMTGLHPHTTGIYGHIDDEKIRSANHATAKAVYLPEYFKKHGYQTFGVGKLFHGHAPKGVFEISGGREKGFGPAPENAMNWKAEYTQTDWGPFPESDAEMPDHRAATWAAERLAEPRDGPFFLAVGFLRPHVPWHVPRKWFDLHPIQSVQTPPYLPNDFYDIPAIAGTVAAAPMMPTTDWAIQQGKWTEIVQAYLACVSFVDHCVGMVLDALERSPYAKNTIVILWSDHGYHLGEKNRFAKHALWNEANRVPLIISGPGLPAGQRVSKPVGLIDLYPTLLDLCRLPANPQVEGRSIVPLLKNPNADWNRPVLTAYGRSNYAVTGERYRYIRYEDGSEELYDLLTDRNEWRNLAGLPQFQSIKEGLAGCIPKAEAPWAEASNNPITPYFQEQKRRMGTQPPVSVP